MACSNTLAKNVKGLPIYKDKYGQAFMHVHDMKREVIVSEAAKSNQSPRNYKNSLIDASIIS